MNILMFTHNMDKKNGGVTFALKTRAEVLSKNNHNVFVVTHGFSTNPQIKPTSYSIINIFDYFSKKKGQKIKIAPIHYRNEILYKDKNTENCFRVFNEGEYKQYRQYNSHGNIKTIDYFESPWKRTKKYILHKGLIVKIFHMDDTNKPKIAKYIKNKNCYITTTVDPHTWKDISFFNHTNKIESSNYDFKINFIEKYIKDNNIEIIFIDKREDINIFLKIKEVFKKIKLIFVLHSNHYNDYINSKGLHKSLTPLFNNIDSFHRVIILTYEQKNNIIEEIGYREKMVVVSNIIDYKELKNATSSRKNLISIGRYEDVKNMIEMIDIFDLVKKEIDDIRLDLYGYGGQRKKLEKLAKSKNIGIHDFIADPREIMRKSSAFLFTSKYEGHPLVLLECYDAQCPVFSYDIKFGAKDIITNYENGLIIKDRDKEEMAQQIIAYIRKEYDFNFSKKCSEVFSIDNYVSQLTEIFEETNG